MLILENGIMEVHVPQLDLVMVWTHRSDNDGEICTSVATAGQSPWLSLFIMWISIKPSDGHLQDIFSEDMQVLTSWIRFLEI